MEAIHTEKYKGFTIEIHPDEDARSPREDDNNGIMACFHRRYDLGDKQEWSVEDLKEYVTRADVISLPLYLFDHSGITMRTEPFNDRWDSGQVGWIYMDLAKLKKDGHLNKGEEMYFKMRGHFSPEFQEKIEGYLRNEVKVYDDYIRGNVYGYEVKDRKGEVVESCWGFIGDYDDKDYSALSEAKDIVDSMKKRARKQAGR